MKIKNRNKVLDDLISKAKKHPSGWSAVFGRDKRSLSNDYYIAHPNVGLYALKEYNKNPFEIKGVGGRLSRNINDVEDFLHEDSGKFGIAQGNIQKILKNIESGVQPRKIVESAFKGENDFGLRMPLRGSAFSSNKSFDQLRDVVSDKQRKLDAKFERMVSNDGVYKSYG